MNKSQEKKTRNKIIPTEKESDNEIIEESIVIPARLDNRKDLKEQEFNELVYLMDIGKINEADKEIKEIVSEALEKYYMSETPVVEVPSQVVKVDNSGNAKLINTLTKAGNLKKVNGENVIKINSGDDLVIQTKGKKYNEAVNLPSETIVHKSPEKESRIKITPTEKESNNEVIEMKNKIINSKNQTSST